MKGDAIPDYENSFTTMLNMNCPFIRNKRETGWSLNGYG
jgi:hypothetical protein